MCYDCGCRMSGEAHGDPKHITDQTFEMAARASDESKQEAMRNVLDLLKEQLGQKK
jgi:hypothetical protein